jgi:hypothetical protein
MRMKLLARSVSLALGILAMAAASYAQIGIGISVRIAPPELPVYEQPICPGDGYLWTPGYWGYADDDYYWIPGTWVQAPEPGFLWTPGYWGWGGDAFLFHDGYWGPTVGFYGGVNYGFGFFGRGYEGGRWDGGHFFYNRNVNNVNVNIIHNTYNTTIINNNRTINRISYNGGTGGIDARATAEEEAAARGRHVGPVAAQTEHVQAARSNPQLRNSVNHGNPPIAATPRPGAFTDKGVVAGRGGANNGAHPPVHPNEIPAAERPAAPNTGNPKTDQKYQKQQDKLAAQQNKERSKLQQQQDREHTQLTKQKADDNRRQQVEQRHQQQTQQLVQRHSEQQQRMQTRQQPAHTESRPAERH